MSKNKWFSISREFRESLYSKLFSWKLDTSQMPEYGMTTNEQTGVGGGVGGMMPDGQTYSTFYVGVEDIDATVAKAEQLGARIIMPKMDVPNGPTIAMFEDPDGNKIGLVQNNSMQMG